MSISTALIYRLIQKTTLCAVGLTAFGVFCGAAMAQEPSSPSHAANTSKVSQTAQDSRVEDVSLADVDVSTSQGMRVARERLRAMAQRICAGHADKSGLSSAPIYVACVDSTVAAALANASRLRQANATLRNSVTRAGNVSIADLNLSTPEGFRVAHERFEAMATRLCAELARNRSLSYLPNWAACVNDTIAGALAQAKVLAAEKETRIARRLSP